MTRHDYRPGLPAALGRRFVDALRAAAADPAAEPFLQPPDAPGYGAKVALPIDLSTLLRRALHGYYRSPAAARADVELLRANAAAFNPDGHPIRAAADGLARALAAALRDDGDEAVAPLPAPSVAADAGAGADAHADAADGGGGGGGGEAHAIDE
jgi:hypothetical protein